MMKFLLILFTASLIMGGSPIMAASNIEKLSKKLVKSLKHVKNKKVAVLSFPYHNDRISSGSSVVSERIITNIVGKKGIRVVERRLLKKILEEQHLSETGVIDPSTAKKIGSILGVDAIVTGTLVDLDNGKTEINARVIEASTGEILGASIGYIHRIWSDKPRRIKIKNNRIQKDEIETVEIDYEESDLKMEFGYEPEPRRLNGKSLKLSNESFPPGRRHYHSTKPQKEGDHVSEEYEDEYYEDHVPHQTSRRKTNKKFKKKTRTMSDEMRQRFKNKTRRKIKTYSH